MIARRPSWSLLTRPLFEEPVVALLIGVLSAGHWPALLGLVLFLLHSLFAAGAGMASASIDNLKAARRSFFDRPDNLRLHPIKLESLIPKEVLETVKFRRPSFARDGIRRAFELSVLPVRAFWVEVLRFPVPTEWRAYPGSVTTQFIFILDPPSKMSAFNRFRMLHELHHVSIAGVGAVWQKYVPPLIAPVGAFGVFTIVREDPSHGGRWILVLMALGVWLCWEFFFAAAIRGVVSEVKADEFAIWHLPPAERVAVLNCCVALWRSASRQPGVSRTRRIEWHLRIARMTETVTTAAAANRRRDPSAQTASTLGQVRVGRAALAALRGAIFAFGPVANAWFFVVGRSVHPQSFVYLVVPAIAVVVAFVRAGVLIERSTTAFSALQRLLVARGLARV